MKKNKGFILFFLAVIAGSALSALHAKTTLPRVGVNVEGLHQFINTRPFTDLFKITQGWFTSCEFDWVNKQAIDPGCTAQNSFNTREQGLLDLDENGWVRSLPKREDDPVYTSVVSAMNLEPEFPLGRYVLLYSGKGEVSVSGSLNVIEKEPGRIVFNLIGTRMGLKIRISKISRFNYIHNIRLVAEKNEKTYEDQPFSADYLARMRPFEVIRLMPWSNPRQNDIAEWDQSHTPAYARYTEDRGVPVKTMIDLTNTIDATPWLNIPYRASDKMMREYAYLARRYVKPDKKVYIELSNEMWNVIFPSTHYAFDEALKLWPKAYLEEDSYSRKVKLANNWYGKRSVEMCNIWKRVFSSDPQRLVCVIASQSNIGWVGQAALDCPLWDEGPCGSQVHAYAVGPYFGEYIPKKEHRDAVTNWAKSEQGLDTLFAEIEHGGQLPDGPKGGAIKHFVDNHMKPSMQLADSYGLPLLAYEAGQHLIRYDPPHQIKDNDVLKFFQRANSDPRMGKAYQQYLKAWEENGGSTLIHFYGIGKSTPQEFFGLLPSSSSKTSPKYDAILQYLYRPYRSEYQHSQALSSTQLEQRRAEARKAAYESRQ